MKFLYAITVFFLLLFPPPIHAQEALFVPNELIVRYKEGNTPARIQQEVLRRQTVASRFLVGGIQIALENQSIRRKGERLPEEKLAAFRNAEKEAGFERSKQMFTDARDQTNKNITNTFLIKTTGNVPLADVVKTYESLPGIMYAQPNYFAYATVTPNDPLFSSMWNLTRIQMENAWNITQGSNMVKVAVIDTGIDYNHEDFQGRTMLAGKDFTSCALVDSIAGTCVTVKDPDDDPMDDQGHGTHVAGTIAAVTDNSRVVSGINWNMALIGLKTMSPTLNGNAAGTEADINTSITYAADNGADVINMSLGFLRGCNELQPLQNAINYARERGVAVVVAAGNSNIDAATVAPSSCTGVISVAATDQSDARADFSNYGEVIDLAAPGVGIISLRASAATFGSGNNWSLNGTSMASPHVAGVAALLLAKNPNLTPDQIEGVLKSTADAISTDQSTVNRRLNALRALQAVDPITPTPTDVEPSQTATPIPSNSPQPLASDVDRNGCIGLADFNGWLTAYQTGNVATGTFPDINNDSTVNLLDFNEWFKSMRGGQNLCP